MKTHYCPLCGRNFADAKTLGIHMATTSKHENTATYIRRLQFMLAEAEDNLKFWRDAVRMRDDSWNAMWSRPFDFSQEPKQ